jgi:hypothetical protein
VEAGTCRSICKSGFRDNMRTTFFQHSIRYGSLSGPMLLVASRLDLPMVSFAHCVVGAALLAIAIIIRQPFDLEKLAERPDLFIPPWWLRRQIIFGGSASFLSLLAVVLLEMNAPPDRWLMIGLLLSWLLVIILPAIAMNASDAR